MVIRKATSKEIEEILDYAHVVMKEATVGYVKIDKDKPLQMVYQFLSNGGYYLVYTKDDVILGWIGVGTSLNFYLEEIDPLIIELYVLPRYRNRDIARKLLRYTCARLKNEGYERVQLNVFKGNYAKHLYESLGFCEISTIMEKEL